MNTIEKISNDHSSGEYKLGNRLIIQENKYKRFIQFLGKYPYGVDRKFEGILVPVKNGKLIVSCKNGNNYYNIDVFYLNYSWIDVIENIDFDWIKNNFWNISTQNMFIDLMDSIKYDDDDILYC